MPNSVSRIDTFEWLGADAPEQLRGGVVHSPLISAD